MKKFGLIASFILVLISCKNTTPSTPKLVILLSVDQMKGDYIDRFNPQFSKGLRTLLDQGYNFTKTHHFHANTTTAAGHAALSTGCYPIINGIVANNIYNRKNRRWEYSILDSTAVFEGIDSTTLKKVSYANLKKPSLGDIVKVHYPEAKSFSVSLKDRASIALGGKKANRAFWFDAASTQMVSTKHYSEPFFDWVKEYKANNLLADDLAAGWQLSANFTPEAQTSADFVEQERGVFSPEFPHTIASMDSVLVSNNRDGAFIWQTPFGDKYVLEFAKKLIAEEQLGMGNQPDVLTISLSSADLIGHHFGPNSYEVQDYYLKLDIYLGQFIDFLNQSIGEENYILALSGDHGVAQFPVLAANEGKDAKRILREQYAKDFMKIDSLVQAELGLTSSSILEVSYKGLEPNFQALQNTSIDSLTFFTTFERYIKRLPYILEVYNPFDMEDEKCDKPFINEVRNSYDIQKNTLLYLLQKENYLIDARANGTTHGTPFTYDTHVPLIFFGKEIKPGQNSDNVQTVDVTPTLLQILGIEASGMNGKPLLP